MKAFLLVHGAWQGSECWEKIAYRLRADGRSVIIPDLQLRYTNNLSDEKQLARCIEYLTNIISRHESIVAVGHSIGGIFISQLAEAIPEHIEALVYISGFLLKDGQCANDTADLMNDSLVSRNMYLSKDKKSIALLKDILREAMYHDANDEDYSFAQKQYRDQALWTFQSSLSLTEERFGSIPKIYIECLKDIAIPLTAQRAMQENWKCKTIYSLNCSHSPFYSMPDELAKILTDL